MCKIFQLTNILWFPCCHWFLSIQPKILSSCQIPNPGLSWTTFGSGIIPGKSLRDHLGFHFESHHITRMSCRLGGLNNFAPNEDQYYRIYMFFSLILSRRCCLAHFLPLSCLYCIWSFETFIVIIDRLVLLLFISAPFDLFLNLFILELAINVLFGHFLKWIAGNLSTDYDRCMQKLYYFLIFVVYFYDLTLQIPCFKSYSICI